VLRRLQAGLESLYRIDTELSVEDFLVDADTRDAHGVARSPREQLLVREDGGELSLGLFLASDAMEELAQSPSFSASPDPFLLAVEGVSHFLCVAWHAQHDRGVSQLELELQGEVDKYVTCALEGHENGLRSRLFVDVSYDPTLGPDERARYVAANHAALRYSSFLERHYISTGRTGELFSELRRFYRLPLASKLERISCGV